ncbi:MAG: hypothetical protein AAF654_03510 [Myxococcota bacterium]
MAKEDLPATSGVQDLIDRIRDGGVKAAEAEANRLLDEAQNQANRLLEDARAEAEGMRAQARSEIEMEKAAALASLKLAARDTGLHLQAAVVHAFEETVKRLVSPETRDPQVVRALLLVLAGHSVEEFIDDQDLRVFISDVFVKDGEPAAETDEGMTRAVLGLTGDMLRDGIEIVPSRDVRGGARVQVVDDNLEIDLTDETVSKLLLKHLLPRFRRILE